MRKAFAVAFFAASIGIFIIPQSATAQGIVPNTTATAPKATEGNAKGIKDNGVKGCGNCGLTGGRMKARGGKGRTGTSTDWVVTMPTKRFYQQAR